VGSYAAVKVVTGPNGEFTINGLPPGTYRIDIETQGFKRTTQQNIQLVAGPPMQLKFTLQAGSTNEIVEIKAHAPMVQGTNGEVGMALTERILHELPIIDRNQQQLVQLQAGITPPETPLTIPADPDRNRFYSAIGQAPTANTWQTDNVYNQEQFRGTAIRVQPVENVQSMNISTASQSADKGFNGGANVNEVSRPGTNGLHGSLYEFYSGNRLVARAPFNIGGNPDTRLNYNQYGLTVGGPIKKDKTFFFGSYQGLFNNGSNTAQTTVPVPSAITGNFSGIPGVVIYNPFTGLPSGLGRTLFAGNVINPFLINPANQTIANLIPAPNAPGYVNNLVSNVPYQIHSQKFDGRIDQHFSDTTAMFLRYGYSNDWGFNGSPLGPVLSATAQGRTLGQNVVADVNHIFTPSLITDFRFGYNRYDQRLNNSGTPFALGLAALPGIGISGLDNIGSSPFLPQRGIDNDFNWVWSWSWVHNRHTVKWGVDIRRFRVDGFTETPFGSLFGSNSNFYFGPGATLNPLGPGLSQNSLFYNSFAAFLLNTPSQTGALNYLTTPTIRQSEYSLWVGDMFQLSPRVSIDLGGRYEVYTPLRPANAGGAMFYNTTNNTFNFAGIGGVGMSQTITQLRNVAPRVGIAVHGDDHTVFRAGYAINYYQPPYALSGFMPTYFGTGLGVQGGFTTVNSPIGLLTPPPFPLTNGFPNNNLPVAVTPRNNPTPYVQTFSAQVQREMWNSFVASVGYVGALGRHQPFIQELNAAFPGTGVAGLPFGPNQTSSVLLFQNGVNSNYNSLQIQLNKRFAEGLAFTFAYTYSKTLGDTSSGNYILNPFGQRANYGPLPWDRRNVLTFSHVWEIPLGKHGSNVVQTLLGGWQLNGIFTWATGTPLQVTANPLFCNCPNLTVLAVPTGATPTLESGTQFLNPAAFTAPPFGSLGSNTRGWLNADSFTNYNMSLFKNFHFRDRYTLELRGEAYNISNTPHWANPITNINAPDFGQQTSLLGTGFGVRQLNVGARILF
jgi:hypothetical protein